MCTSKQIALVFIELLCDGFFYHGDCLLYLFIFTFGIENGLLNGTLDRFEVGPAFFGNEMKVQLTLNRLKQIYGSVVGMKYTFNFRAIII